MMSYDNWLEDPYAKKWLDELGERTRKNREMLSYFIDKTKEKSREAVLYGKVMNSS